MLGWVRKKIVQTDLSLLPPSRRVITKQRAWEIVGRLVVGGAGIGAGRAAGMDVSRQEKNLREVMEALVGEISGSVPEYAKDLNDELPEKVKDALRVYDEKINVLYARLGIIPDSRF